MANIEQHKTIRRGPKRSQTHPIEKCEQPAFATTTQNDPGHRPPAADPEHPDIFCFAPGLRRSDGEPLFLNAPN